MNSSFSPSSSPYKGYSSLSISKNKTPIIPEENEVYEYLEDESLKNFREEMLLATSFDSVSSEELERLYWHLRDYSYYCGASSKYDEAVETEKLMDYIFLELSDRNMPDYSNFKTKIIDSSYFDNIQTKWMNQLIDFDEKTIERVESIKKRHAAEVQVFMSNWRTTKITPLQKVSPTLRDMMNHEEIVAGAGKYNEAKSMRNRITNKARKEGKEAQDKADRNYSMQLEALLKKQQQEILNFLDSRKYKREFIIRRQKDELDVANSKIKVALNKPYSKLRKSEMKLPNQGLVRPIIHINQSNQNMQKAKLLPSICPPPSRNEWVPPQKEAPVEVIKCVPKTRHKLSQQHYSEDTPINRRKMQNALENLNRQFQLINRANENKNNEILKTIKSLPNDDSIDAYTYLQNRNNPTHIKKKKKKKPEETLNLKWATPLQALSKPVKLNKDNIFRMVKEREENKLKQQQINSGKNTKRKNGKKQNENDIEFDDDNDEFKEKISLDSTIKESYDRIVDDEPSKIPEKPIKEKKKFKDIDKILQKYKKKYMIKDDSEEKIQLYLFNNSGKDELSSSHSDEPKVLTQNKSSIDRTEYSKVVNVIYDYSHINFESEEEEEEEFEEEEEEEANEEIEEEEECADEFEVLKGNEDQINMKLENEEEEEQLTSDNEQHIQNGKTKSLISQNNEDEKTEISNLNIYDENKNESTNLQNDEKERLDKDNGNSSINKNGQNDENSQNEEKVENVEDKSNLAEKDQENWNQAENENAEADQSNHLPGKDDKELINNTTKETDKATNQIPNQFSKEQQISNSNNNYLTKSHRKHRSNSTHDHLNRHFNHHKSSRTSNDDKLSNHRRRSNSTGAQNDKRHTHRKRRHHSNSNLEQNDDYESESSPPFQFMALSSSGYQQSRKKQPQVNYSKANSNPSRKRHSTSSNNPLAFSSPPSYQSKQRTNSLVRPQTSNQRQTSSLSSKQASDKYKNSMIKQTSSQVNSMKNDRREDSNLRNEQQRNYSFKAFRNSEEMPNTKKLLRQPGDANSPPRIRKATNFIDDDLYCGSPTQTKTSGLVKLKH